MSWIPKTLDGSAQRFRGGMLEADDKVAINDAGNDEAPISVQAETGISVYKWSVADYDASVAGSADVEADLRPVDVLVNNAGITRDGMFHQLALERWQEVIDTNLSSLVDVTRSIISGMREHGFGRFIDVSSINERMGQSGQVNSSAAKAGDIGFTRALVQEGASKGLTVNAIGLGYIGTKMVRLIPEKVLNERIIPRNPAGHLGEPEEIARCVAFLASDDAGFLTGWTTSPNGRQLFG